MSTTVTPPIINDPAGFVAQQYALLSPNWDALTGKEQYDIISSKYQSIHSGTTTVNGVLPADTTDAQYKQFAMALSQAYIYEQSDNNPEVASLMSFEDITALADAE